MRRPIERRTHVVKLGRERRVDLSWAGRALSTLPQVCESIAEVARVTPRAHLTFAGG